MRFGIQHRDVQDCPRCERKYMWTPALGLCPYCDLSQNARQAGPYGDSEPCPEDCCPISVRTSA